MRLHIVINNFFSKRIKTYSLNSLAPFYKKSGSVVKFDKVILLESLILNIKHQFTEIFPIKELLLDFVSVYCSAL